MAVPSALPGGHSLERAGYGLQSTEAWAAGEVDERPVIDTVPHPDAGAWRVSIVGDVTLRVEWGSGPNKTIADMDSPAAMILPGQCTVYAKPRTGAGARVRVTLAPSWSGLQHDFRRLVDATAGAIAIDPEFGFYQALTASTVSVRGTAVAVPALAILPLVSGSTLTAGVGYLEFIP